MTTPFQPYPSYMRYYLGCIGVGVACGISWTLAMTNPLMQRHITKPHAIIFLYCVTILLFLAQIWMLYRWNKRLKADRAELDRRRTELGNQWTELGNQLLKPPE